VRRLKANATSLRTTNDQHRGQHGSLLLASSYGKEKGTNCDSFTMRRVDNCL